MTSIEWVQDANGNKGKTWNPIVGCSKISAGCQNCYAINQAYRNAAIGKTMDNPGRLAYYEGLSEKRGNRVEWTGKVAFVPQALKIPLRTRKPTTWFVNSMSDLFHESVTFEQLDQVFAVMALTPEHTYQVLTKRPERMMKYLNIVPKDLQSRWVTAAIAIEAWDDIGRVTAWIEIAKNGWPLSNVWLGVTVENKSTADNRIPLLLQTPAAVRFLSCEPLLEEISLELYGINWVIVGGESGPGARPCDINWIRSIVEQCKAAGVPCFVKQLGSKPYWSVPNPFSDPSKSYRDLAFQPHRATWTGTVYTWQSTGKGNDTSEWPEDLRVRQMPSVEVSA